MRRLGRAILDLLVLLSLLLFVAMILLWVRSYWVADTYCPPASVGLGDDPIVVRGIELRSEAGGVRVRYATAVVKGVGRDATDGVRSYLAYYFGRDGWEHGPGERYPTIEVAENQSGVLSVVGLYWATALDPPDKTKTGSVREAVVPYWLPVAVFALPPARRLTGRLRRNRRARTGRCPACGYDLRATPDRCPECGAVPTPTIA